MTFIIGRTSFLGATFGRNCLKTQRWSYEMRQLELETENLKLEKEPCTERTIVQVEAKPSWFCHSLDRRFKLWEKTRIWAVPVESPPCMRKREKLTYYALFLRYAASTKLPLVTPKAISCFLLRKSSKHCFQKKSHISQKADHPIKIRWFEQNCFR